MNWRKALPLIYALGAMVVFALLLRLTLLATQGLGLSPEGHGALSTPKTLLNLGFDALLVLVIVCLYRWGNVPGLSKLGLGFNLRAVRVTVLCLLIILLQYALVILVTRAMGAKWNLAELHVTSVVRGIVLMLGVGIGEEFFFRAGIFNMLRPYGRVVAYLLGTFIFAQAHFLGEPFHVLRLFGTFLPGLLFAYIYDQTGSIWPGAIVHACMNLFSLLFIRQVSGVSIFTYSNEITVTGIWSSTYTLAILVIALMVWLVSRREGTGISNAV